MSYPTWKQVRDTREALTVAIATLDPLRTPERAQDALADAHHALTTALVCLEQGTAPHE